MEIPPGSGWISTLGRISTQGKELEVTPVGFPTAWLDFLPDTLVAPDVAVLGGVWLELLAPWLHGQLSLVDINCHNSKHKISFAFNFVTQHCVRMSRVKVKVDVLENH